MSGMSHTIIEKELTLAVDTQRVDEDDPRTFSIDIGTGFTEKGFYLTAEIIDLTLDDLELATRRLVNVLNTYDKIFKFSLTRERK